MKQFYLETDLRIHLYMFQEVLIFYIFIHPTLYNICIVCVQLVDHTQDYTFSSSRSI